MAHQPYMMNLKSTDASIRSQKFEDTLNAFEPLFSKLELKPFEYRKGTLEEAQLLYIHELVSHFYSGILDPSRESETNGTQLKPFRLQTPRRQSFLLRRMKIERESDEDRSIELLILQLAGYLISPKLASYTDWTAFTFTQRLDFLAKLSHILRIDSNHELIKTQEIKLENLSSIIKELSMKLSKLIREKPKVDSQNDLETVMSNYEKENQLNTIKIQSVQEKISKLETEFSEVESSIRDQVILLAKDVELLEATIGQFKSDIDRKLDMIQHYDQIINSRNLLKSPNKEDISKADEDKDELHNLIDQWKKLRNFMEIRDLNKQKTLLESTDLLLVKNRVCDLSAQAISIDEKCDDLEFDTRISQHLCHQIVSNNFREQKSTISCIALTLMEHRTIPLKELKDFIAQKTNEACESGEAIEANHNDVLRILYTMVACSLIRIDRASRENFVTWA